MNARSVVPAAAALAAPAVPRRGSARAGVVSGLVGGLIMLAFLSFCATVEDQGWLQPLAAIGATAFGGAIPAGAAAIVAGLVLHGIASGSFGLAFAAVLPEDFPQASSVAAGGGFGLLVTIFMMTIVVPVVSPEFRNAAQPIGGSWVVAHALFGGTLAYALTLLRRGAAPRPPADQATTIH